MTDTQTHEILATLARIDERTKHICEKTHDHEHRIRAAEKRQWIFAGSATIVGAIAGKLLSRYWNQMVS